MKRKPLIFFLLLLWLHAAASAQGSLELPAGGGAYEITSFGNDIYRIVFRMKGLPPVPQVSDAVVLAPSRRKPAGFTVKGDSLFYRGRPLVSAIHARGEGKRVRFPLLPGERFYGGGERALPLNRRGYRLSLNNNPWYGYGEGADNLNYSVPFLTSSHGYALFFNNASRGYLDIGREDPSVLEWSTLHGPVEIFFILGDFKKTLQSFHLLTGRQPLPPRWAMGNLMSRFGYTGESQVRDIYRRMQAAGAPVDAVIFDLFWFGDSIKGTMGNLDWVNRNAWPDPQRMIADFRKEGVRTILVTEPFFVETARQYAASRPYLALDSSGAPYYLTDFYFGRGGLLDIFRKDAQQWFWQFYKKQMEIGVEGWWGDLGEPEKHPSDMYHRLDGRLFKADEVHNIYGHAWTKMLYDFYRKEYPAKRLFSLNRSGFAGTQRYSIFPWTGDVSRSWEGLRAQLPVLLGMTMSGVPYVHSDAGGFAGGTGDAELYLRWLQFAVFTPVFRPHGTALYEKDSAAFSFPSEAALIDTPYRQHAVNAINRRYAYFPLNYTLAYRQAVSGAPLMAPLYYAFPGDTAAAKVEDQYCWGPDMMVVPLLQKGMASRRYYLPRGRWYHPGRDTILSGGRWHLEGVRRDDIPVLYREGSFIIRQYGKGGRNLQHYRGDSLYVVHLPAARPDSGLLYSDDGESRNSLAAGAYELLHWHSSGIRNRKLTISLRSGGGTYKGRSAARFVHLFLPGKWAPGTRVHYSGRRLQPRTAENGRGLHLFFEYAGTPSALDIRW